MENQKSKSYLRTELLYATLRDKICLLEYAPGEKLSEDQLATEFGVSRTPIRTVIRMLMSDKLVESHHGVGTFVSEVKFSQLNDVYDMRMELAALIGKLSPRIPSHELLVRGRDIVNECKGLSEKPSLKSFADIHLRFFWILSDLIGNEILRDLTIKLQLQTTRIWLLLVPDDMLAQEIERFYREISDIMDAIELHDFESVGYLLRSHISMSFARLKRYETQIDIKRD